MDKTMILAACYLLRKLSCLQQIKGNFSTKPCWNQLNPSHEWRYKKESREFERYNRASVALNKLQILLFQTIWNISCNVQARRGYNNQWNEFKSNDQNKERMDSKFSSQHHSWIKCKGHRKKVNDRQLKRLLIIEQILLVSTIGNVRRTV